MAGRATQRKPTVSSMEFRSAAEKGQSRAGKACPLEIIPAVALAAGGAAGFVSRG